MSPLTIFARVPRALYTVGWRETARNARKTLLEEYWRRQNVRFDRRYGVDTGGRIEARELRVDSENRTFGARYEPTPPRTFASLMRHLPADLSAYTFVDFGSGKGRVLLLASRYHFSCIIGVEYAKDLHAIASRNVHTYRDPEQVCRNIIPLNIDATEFAIPHTPCVFYFFQPFGREVMTRVLDNIKRSLLAPRPIYLIMALTHPSAAALISSLDFVVPVPLQPLPHDWAWLYSRQFFILSNSR